MLVMESRFLCSCKFCWSWLTRLCGEKISRGLGSMGTQHWMAGVRMPEFSPRLASDWLCDAGRWTPPPPPSLHLAQLYIPSSSLVGGSSPLYVSSPSPTFLEVTQVCDVCLKDVRNSQFQRFVLKFPFQWVVYLKALNLL